ncbi:MAG: DUF6747 family protein [Bacteroidota bacterium]
MKNLLLFKEIYLDGFRDLGNLIAKYYFKILFWMASFLFLVVIYAFVYRVATGFPL